MSSVTTDCQELLEELSNNKDLDFEQVSQLLAKFRVLTREKSINPEVLGKRCIDCLVDYSVKCHTEAQKCLSNLILNYSHFRNQLLEPYISCVESRWTTILNENHHSIEQLSCKKKRCELLYYDLRIIFLLSALCSSSRLRIRDCLLETILKITDKEAGHIGPDNYLLVVESLKTIFNLTLGECINKPLLGNVIKKLFVVVEDECNIKTGETEDKILVNLIHLLTNMPEEIYLMLSNEDVNKVLKRLDLQLKVNPQQNFRETVLPILNVCANVCKFNEEVRKIWFEEIIGSTQDFEKRPEEYDNLRGRLVKLMTSLDVHIKDIAAEFIYALCDGDTEKFITYTGFGNSAAFLSSRGLLMGNRKPSPSSEESNSYEQLRNRIDPITGKLETPKKNPMEGMSEEEKEYHASELADAITKLSNLGVIKLVNNDNHMK